MSDARESSLAACGLDCGSCDIRRLPSDPEAADRVVVWYRSKGWLGEHEGVSEAIARSMYCNGCLGDRTVHWSADCWILKCCVDGKGLKSCSACESFPCTALTSWSKQNASYGQAFERLCVLRAGGSLSGIDE